MRIWYDDWCGSNYGPYIEIESYNGEKRRTHFHGPFSKGERLIWDNNGENRWGAKNLGGLTGFQVTTIVERAVLDPNHYRNTYIKYRMVGGGSDYFCPLWVTFYTTDGYEYKEDLRSYTGYLSLWVNNRYGNGWRAARRDRP